MTEDYFPNSCTILFFILLILFWVAFYIFHKRKSLKNLNWVMAFNDNALWKEEKEKLLKLRCSVKNYDWGRIGCDSQVYRLYSSNSRGRVDRHKPYAEFWMGTHESGPSHLIRKGKILGNGLFGDSGCFKLKSWIERNPHVLGDKVREKWGCDLPFLFKVLSISKPLSIQAHPCKELAKKLHIQDSSLYKDSNHKPEMALAITEFEALCGFVCNEDLQKILDSVPEISQLVGAEVVNQISAFTDLNDEEEVRVALKRLFTKLMSASKHKVADALSQLTHRLMMTHKSELTPKEELVLRLIDEYPNDVGVLAAFLMNYVKLNPGEALCLEANELHAYVSGDCVECMATSDNVVRAGLTPKHRDVETLCDMLTYRQGRPDILRGFNIDGTNGCTKRYRPPFEEFEVDHCALTKGMSTIYPGIGGPSLFLVTEGIGIIRTCFSAVKLHVGDVLFVPANTKLCVESETRFEVYRAGVNSKFL